MKASLQVRLGQQITMTPQLQQAIRLLQLSSLELHQEIQQALESNIMLEEVAEDEYETSNSDNQDLDFSREDDFNSDSSQAQEKLSDSNPDLSSVNDEGSDEIALANLTDIPNELAVDSKWEDIYDSILTPTDLPHSDDKDFLANQRSAAETLQDHLQWQLDLTPFSDLDRAIATAIIDAIDGDGYLRAELSEIAQTIGRDPKPSTKEIGTVLRRLQHFDPLGVGARNLSECMLLQLKELAPDTPQLSKSMKLTRDQLREVVKLILSLNPRPGAQIEPPQTTYVIPDVYVKKVHGQWKVDLNPEVSPKLRVNSYYAGLISRNNKSADNQNLKNHLQEARWFIKSLKSRQDTLLKVAKSIVKHQSAFLDYGEEAMKPLILHDIASELEMHESTISRVTTQKYIHTPLGIFELKYFFSSHVATQSGGECSSTAIRIKVARRTVAKYREAMVIPPSNERKRLA